MSALALITSIPRSINSLLSLHCCNLTVRRRSRASILLSFLVTAVAAASLFSLFLSTFLTISAVMVHQPIGERGTEICFGSFNFEIKVFRSAVPSPILIAVGIGAGAGAATADSFRLLLLDENGAVPK